MNWERLNDEFNKSNYFGNYGADNIPMHVLTKAKYGIDIRDHIKKKSNDEFIDPDLKYLINKVKNKNNNWEKIGTLNPHGLESYPPTISSVRAKLDLNSQINYKKDGIIVNKDGLINCLKIAIEQVWSLSKISKKLNIDEKHLRKTFSSYLNDNSFLDTKKDLYLPSLGGISVFVFGDIKKLENENTEITLRVHDACLNSDCFRGTICTCSPYLLWAIENCVKTAQNGGVGLIFYYRKEGRSLGEVIKFRVYSAREGQKCGDIPEKYFSQTVNIAGIEDARHQELMPDPLLWLGIKKIDNLYSMSNVKYDAMNKVGIYAKNRFDLPRELVPKDAEVEIDAKIDSGYHVNKK
jgi:GTP cyclohydrolase II